MFLLRSRSLMKPKTYKSIKLNKITQKLVNKCISLGLISDCVWEEHHPMLIFPDGEKICFDDGTLERYLEGMLKSKDMIKCGFTDISDDDDLLFIIDREQAIALRDLLTKNASSPDIKDLLDALENQTFLGKE